MFCKKASRFLVALAKKAPETVITPELFKRIFLHPYFRYRTYNRAILPFTELEHAIVGRRVGDLVRKTGKATLKDRILRRIGRGPLFEPASSKERLAYLSSSLGDTQRPDDWVIRLLGKTRKFDADKAIDAKAFLKRHPYNGTTIYKGAPGTDLAKWSPSSDGDAFFSGRPPVAIGYAHRNNSGLLAVGDVRSSGAFNRGETIFTPHTLGAPLSDRLKAVEDAKKEIAKRGKVPDSHTALDYEIRIPAGDVPDVYRRMYRVRYTGDGHPLSDPRTAKRFVDPSTFDQLPYEFREIDMDKARRLADKLLSMERQGVTVPGIETDPSRLSRALTLQERRRRHPVLGLLGLL